MFWRNRNKVLVVIIAVLLFGSSASSRPRKLQRVQQGAWGGPNIRMAVGSGSATIDYACANGTIDGPLTVDSKGRFSWRGFHHAERPGPVRIDDESNKRPAIYSGWVKGDTMTLTVKLADTNEVVQTFTLKRGGPGRVFKCK